MNSDSSSSNESGSSSLLLTAPPLKRPKTKPATDEAHHQHSQLTDGELGGTAATSDATGQPSEEHQQSPPLLVVGHDAHLEEGAAGVNGLPAATAVEEEVARLRLELDLKSKELEDAHQRIRLYEAAAAHAEAHAAAALPGEGETQVEADDSGAPSPVPIPPTHFPPPYKWQFTPTALSFPFPGGETWHPWDGKSLFGGCTYHEEDSPRAREHGPCVPIVDDDAPFARPPARRFLLITSSSSSSESDEEEADQEEGDKADGEKGKTGASGPPKYGRPFHTFSVEEMAEALEADDGGRFSVYARSNIWYARNRYYKHVVELKRQNAGLRCPKCAQPVPLPDQEAYETLSQYKQDPDSAPEKILARLRSAPNTTN